MQKLSGKIAVVTGATGSLGTAVTRSFAAEGAVVIAVSRSPKPPDPSSTSIVPFKGDVSTASGAAEAVRAIRSAHGRFDVLVHLVGGFAGGQSVANTSDETLDRMLDLNFRAAFFVMRAALPVLCERPGATILAVASRAAVEPSPNAAAYAASKAALVSLVQSIAAENAESSLTANCVLPGALDTSENRASNPTADPSNWVPPARVGSLLVWLASDEGRSTSGAAIPVFGR